MKRFLCVLLSVIYLNILSSAMVFADSVKKAPDYQNLVNLDEKDVIFTTKLSNKYIGKDYTLINNYEKPIIIKNIELKNNRGIVPVYKNSSYSIPLGIQALSCVGGFLGMPTFVLIPAEAENYIKNKNIKKEAKANITKLPQKDIIVEPGKNFEVKAIFDKTQALNRNPDIKFTCYNPENKHEFVITANTEDEKTQETLNSKEEAIRQLTDSGLKPDSKLYAGLSIIEDDTSTLGLFMDAGMNPNTKYLGAPFIDIAITQNQPDIVKLLIDKGVDVNAKYLGTPIIVNAITKNQHDIVKLLLDKGADANTKYMGQPIIYNAIILNKPDIAELLIDRGADANTKFMGVPIIVYAVIKNQHDVVMMLVDKDVDVNTKSRRMTALQAVIYKNYPDIAIKLLEKGANPNASGFGGETPLLMAVKRNQVEVVKMLIEKGANLNQKSKLLKIANKKKYTEIEKMLVDYQNK